MRLVTDGAEFADTKFWDVLGGTVTAVSNVKKSGDYSYNIDGSGDSNTVKYFTASGEVYLSIGLRYTGSNQTKTIVLLNGSTIIGVITRNPTSKLMEVKVGETLVATGTKTLDDNQFYQVAWHLKIADSQGISEIKIDNVPDAYFGGDTKPDANTEVNGFSVFHGGNWASIYVDDMALNNTDNSDGKGDISWPGPFGIVKMSPAGEGYTNQWSCSTGTVHWSLVDEFPYTSTDYVYSSTANQIDAFTLPGFDGSNKQIKRVWIETRAYDEGAAGSQISLGLRTTEGTNYFSSVNNTLSGSYSRHVSSDFIVNPATSTVWEDADLDALQLLIKEIT